MSKALPCPHGRPSWGECLECAAAQDQAAAARPAPAEVRRFRVRTDVGTYEPQWAEIDLILYPDGTVGWVEP